MYKYFNAGSGAVLAGPNSLLKNLFQTRRMFGGGLHRSWPFAAVALHYFDGFGARYARAVAASEKVVSALQSDSRFGVRRVPDGTNIFQLTPVGVSPQAFQQRAQEAGITIPASASGRFTLSVNETWNRIPPEEVVQRLRKALG